MRSFLFVIAFISVSAQASSLEHFKDFVSQTKSARAAFEQKVYDKGGKLTQEAKQASLRSTEAQARKAAEKIAAKVEKAEAKIRDAVYAARTEIEAVAVEATQEMVQRLTGKSVERAAAEQAVKAELNV